MGMLIYDALIEDPVSIQNGFRFNVYTWIWDDVSEKNILDLYLKGFRVFGGRIHLPAYSNRQPYPNVYLPREIATVVVKRLLEVPNLHEQFPNVFPLLREDLLIEGLLFPKIQLINDFPRLAFERGYLLDK